MARQHGTAIQATSVTAAYDTTGNGQAESRGIPLKWRAAFNGRPEGTGYRWRDRDAARGAEVAAEVAAIRAEALRRAGLPDAKADRW
jgi:hypothetical protein